MVWCPVCSEYIHGRRMKRLHNGEAKPIDFEKIVHYKTKKGTKTKVIHPTPFMIRIYKRECPNYLR